MTGRLRTGGWLFWLNFGLSLAIHIRIALYLLPDDPEKLGAAPMPTTAISVNIETTDVLDAVEQSAIAEAAAASSTPGGEPAPQEEVKLEQPEQPAETVEARSQAAPEEKAKPEPDPRPEPPVSAVEERPEPAEILEQSEKERIAEEALRRAMEAELERRASEIRALEATRQERPEREAEARQRVKKEKRRQQARRRNAAPGSAGASGSRSAQSSRGRVSASQGAIRNYAAMVRARIARHKPPGRGAKGRVVIGFGLSPSGRLLFSRIVASSGDRALDQAALAALRRASPFPTPPAGASAAQLRFTIPFQFH